MMPDPAAGQTIMVTGANSGIGKATARLLAERGARVVMVCRNPGRGEPARREIAERTGSGTVELLTADFESLDQVRALARAYVETHDRLDGLINNAGLYLPTYRETTDGYEVTWAVNHLAPFLLTNLLLDVLKASAPARIVNVSSNSHYGAAIHFDDLNGTASYSWMEAYGQSKLANVLFTYELARRLDGTGVTAKCLHPGMVATRIWNRSNNPISLFMRPFKLFMQRPSRSARAVVRLAVDPELEGVTGAYFDQIKEKASSEVSYDRAVAEHLWRVSAEATGLE
jgi:NAD(P)-dependent dehydrogenase (short-subunit alcohol dehydrogenase family)